MSKEVIKRWWWVQDIVDEPFADGKKLFLWHEHVVE